MWIGSYSSLWLPVVAGLPRNLFEAAIYCDLAGPIADRLTKAGWTLGWVSAVDSEGRTIWIVDAHRGDGKRFVVHADEKLSAFVELEREVLTVTFYLESIQ